MGIAENIKALREDRGITQEELGRVCGLSSMAVSQWENGRAVPRMGSIERLSRYFGIPKSELIDDTSDGYVEWPLYGSIAAGTPIDMQEVDSTFPIPASLTKKFPDSFFLHTEGDSMNRIIPSTISKTDGRCL